MINWNNKNVLECSKQTSREVDCYKPALILLLALSLLLRLYTVMQGGQFFWPDEERYKVSGEAVQFLRSGEVGDALVSLFARAHHLGFKVIGTIPAAIEMIIGADPRIPALLFSLFSLGNIWLVWRLVLALGGGRSAALFAATLMSLSASMLYWSRHLVPYDVSLFFALLAMLAGVSGEDGRIRSFVCGVISLMSFTTYLGHWSLVPVVLAIHAMRYPLSIKPVLRRSIMLSLGFTLPLMSLIVATWVVGYDLLASMIHFCEYVVLGEYSEGWRLPFEYLWNQEHCICVFWLAALCWSIWQTKDRRAKRIGWIAAATVFFLYFVFVLFSVGFSKFVVYGRLVRQMVPFLCIAGGLMLGCLWSRKRWRIIVLGSLVLIAGQGLYNLYPILAQDYPETFTLRCQARISENANYAFVNTRFIYPAFRSTPLSEFLPDSFAEIGLSEESVTASALHPQQYIPSQFEGYTRAQREHMQKTDFRMRLVKISE